MFHGLRLRLTLLYTLVALLFVSVLGISTYQLLARYFQSTTDLGLQHKMAHELRLLGAPIPPELAAADRDWYRNRAVLFPSSERVSDDDDDGNNDDDDETIEESYAEEFYDGELSAIFVLPLNADGQLLFDPNPYTPPLTPDAAAAANAYANGHDWRTITLDNGSPVRLLTYRVTRADGPAVLQLGRALIDQQRILQQMVVILLSLGSASVALLGMGSWWLAGRAIAPAQDAWTRQQTFIANASHELRTPLALIRASAEAATRRAPADAPRLHELLHDIVQESDHTTTLVNDLLLLSRLDAGRLKITPQPLDLASFLGDFMRQATPLAAERDITLHADSIGGYIQADATRLHQVLLIVLDNALRHTPPGGRITVTTATVGKQVQLVIRDTGNGIDPADLPHVFARFYRSSTARAEGGGNGLGLSIARALMIAMQGQIRLESAPGQGTSVVLLLPATG